MCIKFEYFLNVIHYCLYLEEVWSNKIINKIVNRLIDVIFRIPFIGKYRKEYSAQEVKELDNFYYGYKAGLSISVAHHLFGYFYSAYPGFLSFILLGVAFRYFGEMPYLVVLAIVFVPIGIFYIPAYRAVFYKDRYLKYYKQFEKKDRQWHKKWKRITVLFCVGAVFSMILGLASMFVVLLL